MVNWEGRYEVVAIGEGRVCSARTGSFDVEPVFVAARVIRVVQMQRFIVVRMVLMIVVRGVVKE